MNRGGWAHHVQHGHSTVYFNVGCNFSNARSVWTFVKICTEWSGNPGSGTSFCFLCDTLHASCHQPGSNCGRVTMAPPEIWSLGLAYYWVSSQSRTKFQKENFIPFFFRQHSSIFYFHAVYCNCITVFIKTWIVSKSHLGIINLFMLISPHGTSERLNSLLHNQFSVPLLPYHWWPLLYIVVYNTTVKYIRMHPLLYCAPGHDLTFLTQCMFTL